jgi:hypothetical protein
LVLLDDDRRQFSGQQVVALGDEQVAERRIHVGNPADVIKGDTGDRRRHADTLARERESEKREK